jgi:hypothetical protein
MLTVNGSTTFLGQLVSTSTVLDAVAAATCGGGSPTISGSNGIGRFTTGSGATSSCVVTFGAAFKNKPVCTVDPEASLGTSTSLFLAPSPTTLTVNAGPSSSLFNSLVVDYICIGQ